ncbi:hypothetical protein BDW69DRAFT_65305 [Aspergillus filifer]
MRQRPVSVRCTTSRDTISHGDPKTVSSNCDKRQGNSPSPSSPCPARFWTKTPRLREIAPRQHPRQPVVMVVTLNALCKGLPQCTPYIGGKDLSIVNDDRRSS